MSAPALPFDADTLACALVLSGTPTPTPAQLADVLGQLYPGGGGPTVADVLAAAWLVPTPDGQRLREPPLSPTGIDARLAAAEAPYKTRHPHAPAPADNRHRTGSALPAVHPESRNKAGIEAPPAVLESRELAGKELLPEPPINGIEPEQPPAPLFSYYRGGIGATAPYAAVTPAQLYAVLTSGRYRAQTEALRAAAVGSPERAELKKRLDYVTPAGTFARRANDALAVASGLLVLDFDHLPDVGAARAALLADELLAPDLVLVFTSPSGDGLKILVRTDPTASHLDNFRAWAAYLTGHYAPLGLRADEAGKDVARACFVPYAPDAWLSPAYAD